MCSWRVVVDQVEHRGERRGLARAGRPGHEHEPARLLGEVLEHREAAPSVAQRRHLVRDQAERGADSEARWK